ncbi:hypothetical protein [Aurantimonas sp. 22II-16-19i]|uniref:hypothetical protein n=1 Tax=Aurantimonas sp. 22II-16-19i TaxID=1317114 RepID=UPI0009F7FE4D|nr:hypothetical protein [Aurantimonas sp. 22II-16-19i]ORE90952.1 hypothetical protein ATO4_19859 [Aurantimonas sp. 22II-16-19i]
MADEIPQDVTVLVRQVIKAFPPSPGREFDVSSVTRDLMLATTAVMADRASDARLQAARADERDRIAARLREEADMLPCDEDANVTRGNADLIAADFSYADAEAAAIRKAKDIGDA